jgi:hypothetical protein
MIVMSTDERYKPWPTPLVKRLQFEKTLPKFEKTPPEMTTEEMPLPEMTTEDMLQLAAWILTNTPEPKLLMAMDEISSSVCEWATHTELSPKRTELLAEFRQNGDRAPRTADQTSDASVGRIYQIIKAQWAAREGGLSSQDGRQALAAGKDAFVNRYLKEKQGRDRVRDRLDWPSGHVLCAMAALFLNAAILSQPPKEDTPLSQPRKKGKVQRKKGKVQLDLNQALGRGHRSQKLMRVCSLIWGLAGRPPLHGQPGEDNDDSAWGRYLRDAMDEIRSPSSEARIRVVQILSSHGLISYEPNPSGLVYARASSRGRKSRSSRVLSIERPAESVVADSRANTGSD